MLKNWYILLIFFHLSLTPFAKSDFNHCDVIRKSPNSFADKSVVFVQALDDVGQKTEKSLQSFFKCYAPDLAIQNIFLSSSTTCEVVKTIQNVSNRSTTKWEFIISPYLLFTDCPLDVVKSNVLNVFPSNIDYDFKILGICKTSLECQLLARHLPINDTTSYMFLERNNELYDKLIDVIDNSERFKTTKSQTYRYFNMQVDVINISKFWRTISTMLAIIFFTLLGFFLCLYSLLSLALVEEDFHTRNDEREFLRGLARVQNYQNEMVIREEAPSENHDNPPDEMHTDVTQASTRSPIVLKTSQASETSEMEYSTSANANDNNPSAALDNVRSFEYGQIRDNAYEVRQMYGSSDSETREVAARYNW